MDHPPISIALISGSAHYAPYRKLARSLRGAGASVDVLAFERSWTPGPREADGHLLLGTLPVGNYLSRMRTLARALPRLRAAAMRCDVLHALGFDMMLACTIALLFVRRRPVQVYEVHDIRDVLLHDGFAGRFLRLIDRALVRRTDLLVVTSPGYLECYFAEELGVAGVNSFLLENKVDPTAPASMVSPGRAPSTPLRIGYFGALRCPESLLVLQALAARAGGRFEIVLHGVPSPSMPVADALAGVDGIRYLGPYRSPDDLPALYESVDLVWLAGHNGKRSGAWSRTCRFYEASCFGTPMIGQAGTEDGKRIGALGIGIVLDARDVEGAVDALLSVDRSDVLRWRESLAAQPRTLHSYTDEHSRLVSTLGAIVRTRRPEAAR